MLIRKCFPIALVLLATVSSPAAVVTDITPGGGLLSLAPSSGDFLGVVTLGGTGTAITLGTSPVATSVTLSEALGTIDPNDVVGQDLDGLTGFGSTNLLWSYSISLPANADPGTGLTNIVFDADLLFSDAATNNPSSDSPNRLTFELFVNGASVGSTTHIAPADLEGPISTLTDAGGATITSAEIQVFTTNASAFDAGTETFAVTNASLSADFQVSAVPEPSSLALLGLGGLGLIMRRRR